MSARRSNANALPPFSLVENEAGGAIRLSRGQASQIGRGPFKFSQAYFSSRIFESLIFFSLSFFFFFLEFLHFGRW